LETPDLGNEDGVMAVKKAKPASSQRRYSETQKEQAVRMVFQLRRELKTDRGTIGRVAQQLGIGSESLRSWVRQAEIDRGDRAGVTTEDAQRMKELEQENFELRRANEILRRASAFFAAELDRPQKK
jgi:transposase